MFIVVDGIDGSGKGTIVECLRDALARTRPVFDAREAMRRTGRMPEPADFRDAAAVITLEPTYVWVGAGVREALVRDPAYSPLTVAHAFAADREIHFRRIVLPALAAGKQVVSERGVSGSLAYQFVAGVPEEALLAMPGNRLALEHAPDVLVLARIDPAPALARLARRDGKDDGCYYERAPFLESLVRRFADPAYRRLFTDRGTRIIDLSTEGTLEETRRRVEEELLPLLVGAPS